MFSVVCSNVCDVVEAVVPVASNDQESLLASLEDWGFKVASPRSGPTADAEELILFHRRMVEERSALGYAVDGVVYKLNDLSLQVGE